jgi:hypothetical protein
MFSVFVATYWNIGPLSMRLRGLNVTTTHWVGVELWLFTKYVKYMTPPLFCIEYSWICGENDMACGGMRSPADQSKHMTSWLYWTVQFNLTVQGLESETFKDWRYLLRKFQKAMQLAQIWKEKSNGTTWKLVSVPFKWVLMLQVSSQGYT